MPKITTKTASDANRELGSRRWIKVDAHAFKKASARAERRAARLELKSAR
jgi:hypothetical protein